MAEGSADNDQAQAAGLPLSDELYGSLRGLAHYHLRSQRGDITLNCTSLVHEAYLKLMNSETPLPASTSNYATLASLAMRQIVVDYVRRKRSQKHGGDWLKVTLHDTRALGDGGDYDLLDIDRAMQQLGRRDPYLEELVALRFFAGMSTPEAAAALERSVRSVERDWARARTYLYRALKDLDDGNDE